jgi:integrase
MPKLTDAAAAKLKPSNKRRDHDGNGLYLVIQPSGVKSWAYRYRVRGQSRKLTLGTLLIGKADREPTGELPALSVSEARQRASAAAVKVSRGGDPAVEKQMKVARASNTVDAMLDAFVADHVSGLRSGYQVERAFNMYVRPRLGSKSIYDLQRSDIATMLNEVKEANGPVMADRVLAHFRKALNWQATQDDKFLSPIVRGMAKTKPAERSRKRVLADDEIRDVWAALDKFPGTGCFPRIVKSLLLSMARRNEVSEMRIEELDGDLWTIPAERYKTKRDHVVPVSTTLRSLIGDHKGFAFSTTGGEKPFSGFAKCKTQLDRIVADTRKAEGRPPMKQWQLHDLRRTGRSLMSRAGVPTDHAERAMGHVIGGVREAYDRHEYLEEKRAAFEKLERLLTVILNPQANVVALRS